MGIKRARSFFLLIIDHQERMQYEATWSGAFWFGNGNNRIASQESILPNWRIYVTTPSNYLKKVTISYCSLILFSNRSESTKGFLQKAHKKAKGKAQKENKKKRLKKGGWGPNFHSDQSTNWLVNGWENGSKNLGVIDTDGILWESGWQTHVSDPPSPPLSPFTPPSLYP